MRVLVSQEQADGSFVWQRKCSDISYTQNDFKRDNTTSARFYYQLSFTCQLDANKTCYFAYCFPYTFTDLQTYLRQLEENTELNQYLQRGLLCKTIGGNRLDVLTITDFKNQDNLQQRRGIILTARHHPGESNSSWIMKGCIDFLLSQDSLEAATLRRNFVFKIVPMINVDGVIYGNYRCSLAGIDLNRVWKRPNKTLFPEICAIRKLVETFNAERPVIMFTDIHGHSMARKAFMYGNNYSHNPYQTRLLPYILWRCDPELFSFCKSKFKVERAREGTSRVAIWRMIK